VRATVKNNGTDACPAAVLQLTGTDGFSGTGTIPALAAGASTYVTINDPTLIPSSVTTMSYTATADPGNLIAESVETNNGYTKSNLPVGFNGYKGKALYADHGGNVSTHYTYDLRGGIVHSFGDSYYRSGSFSGGWTTYDVTWKYNPANVTNPLLSELVVPANATIRAVRLYLPYTWDYPNDTRGYDMPDNVTVTFNGNPITYQNWYWDRGNFGEWGPYTYGLLSYNVTSLYQKNATNSLHFERSGDMDKLSLYGMTLAVVYENPAETRKQIFLNEEFDLLGADYANYKTTEAETVAYVPFSGMTIDTAKAKAANLTTFVPSGDSWEGNLYVQQNEIATNVWNYGAEGQPVGENGYPQVAVDNRDILSFLTATDNVIAIQSTAWASQPCMAAAQQFLVVEYQDAPVTAFAADTVTPSVGQTVTFTDQSTNTPTSWSWTFGDGGTSTLQNPAHAFTISGTYTVVLTATNAAGSNTLTKTGYITVTNVTVVVLPGNTNPPKDLNSDGLYEDLNGNNRKDVGDVVLFIDNIIWIKNNEPLSAFDFNHNTRIDIGDVIVRLDTS
jgi:PKD repeat protein